MLGKIHFFFSFIFINGVFGPMFLQGLAGVQRRLWDGGLEYSHAQGVLQWNSFMSNSAFLLGLAQLPFIFNFFWSIRMGAVANSNPGRRQRSTGSRPPRRRSVTATSRPYRWCTTELTSTACRAGTTTTCHKTWPRRKADEGWRFLTP